jgi:hypothetical protein
VSEMSNAIRNQSDHVTRSSRVDRRGWTRQQWVDDARQQMGHSDGSVLALVNGHPTHLLQEIDVLRAALTELAEAAGRVTSDSADATAEVQTAMRKRLLRAEGAAWEVLRPAPRTSLLVE